jgi:hypothetical protein
LRRFLCTVCAAIVVGLAGAANAKVMAADGDALALQQVEGAPAAAFERFLDHPMRAESDGRDYLTNPRSTAVGAFQFIKSTFLLMARQYFAREVGELSDNEVLELRTNRAFARRAAAAYARENAAFLQGQGIRPTFGHLRLAYLVGPSGALKVIMAGPEMRVSQILSEAAVRANPFMKDMTAAGLIAKAQRDIGERGAPIVASKAVTGEETGAKATKLVVRCNLQLVSCRRWVALHSAPRKAPANGV